MLTHTTLEEATGAKVELKAVVLFRIECTVLFTAKCLVYMGRDTACLLIF